MFKPFFGTCYCGCGKQGMIIVKRGYIKQCNERIKKQNKENSPRMKLTVQVIDYKEKMRISKLLQKLPTITTGDKVESPKFKGRKVTGEGEMFEQIWQERVHKCEVCDKDIKRTPKNKVNMFSHVLSKGSTPELRLDKENILLMGDGWFENCYCHLIWEARTAEMRHIDMWRPIFLLQDALKKKAHQSRKNNILFKQESRGILPEEFYPCLPDDL